MVINIYKILMSLLFPLVKVTYIKKRQRIGKEHPIRFNERIGIYTKKRPEGKLYWFHGASVGESVSMLPLIDRLLKEDENLSIMVTTGTITSAEIMAKRLPERAFHQFIPFDVPSYVKNLINHFNPDAVLWFESELWPSFLSEIKKKNIPFILVNGRISDKSYSNWKKFKFISKELLSCFSLCLGQSEQDKNRLKFLGAQKVDCVGNLKYAGMPLDVDKVKLAELKEKINGRRVFVISSTHNNEEEQFADHIRHLQEFVPNLFIIVVPRHPERGIEVTNMFKRKGFSVAQRSKDEPITDDVEIYVADTIGEMGLWYGVGEISFIGGSLINRGGQNFNEPARCKNAVVVGNFMTNFSDMINRAKVNNAVWQLSSATDVIEYVINLFTEPELLKERQENAYAWTVLENKVLDGIIRILNKELKK
jgi:3-deoxy-D-manno-octulosonic-acid transferase